MTITDTQWMSITNSVSIGSTVNCTVMSHHPFGVLVTLQPFGVTGILERIRMHGDGYRTPEEYPAIGACIEAKVLGFRDWNKQVELALHAIRRE